MQEPLHTQLKPQKSECNIYNSLKSLLFHSDGKKLMSLCVISSTLDVYVKSMDRLRLV